MKKAKQSWKRYLGLWERLTGWKLFLFYLLHYTILFLILQRWIFSDFYETGKSFIWITDGASQYFPRLIYIGQTLRDGIQGLLQGNGWTIPLYDFRLGAVKPELAFSPIQMLAVLWPWDRMDEFYDILVLVRFYLAGMAFSAMGFYFKSNPMAVLIGAVSYAFCGYSLYFCMLHPFFAEPMIILPLLIVGAEKVLKGEHSWSFPFLVSIALLSSLYCACMLAVLIVIYFFARYLCVYRKDGLQGFVKLIGRMTLWGGLGILLSGVLLVPTALKMMGTGRIGREVEVALFYDKAYYQSFLTNYMVMANGTLKEGSLGLSVLTAPCIISLFLKKRGSRSMRVLFLLTTGMLMLPTMAYVLSGFNFVINRWSFGYALCVCAIIMFQLPKLASLSKEELVLVLGRCLFYITLCRFVVDRKYYQAEPLALLFVLMVFMALCYAAGQNGRRSLLAIFLAFSCLSSYCGATLRYDSNMGKSTSAYVGKNAGYELLEQGQYASLAKVDKVTSDTSFFRVAGSSLAHYEKMGSFYYGLNGTSFYSSEFYPGYVDMQKELEVKRTGALNANYGNDARAPLLSLLGVKYYATRESAKAAKPYGFQELEQVQKSGSTDSILENPYVLPIGYTYDAYLSHENFSKLSALGKQSAMLQGVLADQAESDFLPEITVDESVQKVPVKVTQEDGLHWQDGRLELSKDQATITLEFKAPANMETYLRIVDFDPTEGNDGESWNSSVWDISVETANTRSMARFIADNYVYAHGAKSQLIYLGNGEESLKSCAITFPKRGNVRLENLEIWCQPMDQYEAQIENLRAEHLENVEINWRGLTGTIRTTKDKFLCFSIPYDEGWTAYVDGERVNLVQANVGFMGVELPAGEHDIELKYWIPGLTAGIVLSGTGLLGMVGLAIYEKKKKPTGRKKR